MIIHNVLNQVFSQKSNIAVLRTLNNVKIGLSGREVARQSGISAPACLATLSLLENLNIVIRNRGGREHFFELNRKHYLVDKIVIPNIYEEKKFMEELFSDIRKRLVKYCHIIIIFGSTAKKEEKIGSDLDVCLVFKNKILKNKAEMVSSELNSLLYKKYGVSYAPYFISETNFFKRAENKKPPVADIIRKGIILAGKKLMSR